MKKSKESARRKCVDGDVVNDDIAEGEGRRDVVDERVASVAVANDGASRLSLQGIFEHDDENRSVGWNSACSSNVRQGECRRFVVESDVDVARRDIFKSNYVPS